MKSFISQLTLAALISSVWASGEAVAQKPSGGLFDYPKTKKADVVEDYHGTPIADPYRWMEELDAPEVKEWIEAQNRITFSFLEEIPWREKIKERLTKLWNYERYGVPFKQGDRYFYTKNDGLQNQSVLYAAESLEAEPRVLLNPNALSADGTIALAGIYVTDDGALMAYALAEAGSDWVEFRVRDVETGMDLPDVIKWVKFSGASWTKDNRGFYYSRYDEPASEKLEEMNYFQKVFYHRLGTPQSEDELIYDRPDQKEWGFEAGVTDDGKYLIISSSVGTERKNRVYYKDLTVEGGPVLPLLEEFDAQYGFIDNDGPVFWFYTDLDAPRGRVIAIDTRDPSRSQWREVIPQSEATLDSVSVVNDMFIAKYLQDVRTQVKIMDLTGKPLRELELPGIGTAVGFGGKRSDSETFYAFTSFAYPTTIFRHDLRTGISSIFKKPQVDFDPTQYEVEQVFYRGKDGTRIPMFITHKKGMKLDGSNPTYLYGYGGFNVSLPPHFSVARLVWLELGGVYAVANIRGGGEYGKDWHNAGRLKNKQNCFDDFIAAGEWLIEKRYTSPGKLAISGASNGGTLVGACMTQRPDLFGACLPDVGVLDMLRFHKFTIGWAWVSDYGNPEDPEMFPVIRAYSPLHNVRPGTKYPATLITTADHDDRVVPSHSFKFAAALQEAQAGENPILIRVETRAGHGSGKPTTKLIEELADTYAFLVRVLDFEPAGF